MSKRKDKREGTYIYPTPSPNPTPPPPLNPYNSMFSAMQYIEFRRGMSEYNVG